MKLALFILYQISHNSHITKGFLTILLAIGFFTTITNDLIAANENTDYHAIKKAFPNSDYVISQRKVTVLIRKNKETNVIEAIRREYNELFSLEHKTVMKRTFYYDNFSSVNRISRKKFFETRGNIREENIFHSDNKFCTFSKYVKYANETKVLEVETVYKDARFFTTEYFTTEVPVINYEFQLEYDTSLNVAYNLNQDGNEAYIVSDEIKDNKRYIAIKADSLKAFKNEEGAVPYKFNYTHVQIRVPFAEVASNDMQHNMYTFINNFTKQTEIDTAALRPLLNEILSQSEENNPIKPIFEWVKTNIRYIAFEYALGGYIPESPNKISENRFSDCKGMACLLKTFLKMEGYDARLGWVSAQPTTYSSDFPAISNFDHMICAVMQNDEPLFLDPTASYSTYGIYPEYLQGKEVLVQNGDNYQLYRIPVSSPSQNAILYNYNVYINKNQAEGQMQASVFGNRKVMASAMLNESGQKQNILNKRILFWGDRSIETKSKDIEREENDTSIHYSQEVILKGNILQNRSNYYITPNPTDIPNISKIDTARERDINFYIKDSLVINAVWNFPEEYNSKYLPTDTTIHGPGAKMSYQYRESDNTILYTRTFIRSKVILPLEQIKEHNQFVDKVKEENKKRIVLSK